MLCQNGLRARELIILVDQSLVSIVDVLGGLSFVGPGSFFVGLTSHDRYLRSLFVGATSRTGRTPLVSGPSVDHVSSDARRYMVSHEDRDLGGRDTPECR